MPKKNSIQPLQTLALQNLAKITVHAIGDVYDENDLALVTIQITSYLSEYGATSNIYQDLLKVILCSDSLEASIRFTSLKMLLNDSVYSLQTEIFPFSYYEKILQVIATQGFGIRNLNLKGVWVKDDHMNYMFEIVRNLKYLTNLSIPYIANDELLEEIGKNCKYLKILDVAGETDITEIGIYSLCHGVTRDNLTYIDIGMLREESICHEDVAMLIENLPNLTNLVTYSYVGRSIRFIHKNNPNFKSKLKYLHDTETSDESLNSIVCCCPDLENVYLDTPSPGIIHQLSKLRRLRQLKLYKFCCKELDNLLQDIGWNINYLTVIKGKGSLDIGRLAYRCPSLIDLDCYLMELLVFSNDFRFENIEGLEILNSCIAKSTLKIILATHAKTLKRIAIDQLSFSDEDLASLILDNEFGSLEDVWFTSAPNLSVSSVEVLMQQCPVLQSLGQLSGWNLEPDDLSFLIGIVRNNNNCLTFSPSSIFP